MQSELFVNAHRIAVAALGALWVIFAWELIVRYGQVPAYIIPTPALVGSTLLSDWGILGPAFVNTAGTALCALFLATIGGVAVAVILAQFRIIELFFAPITVFVQVTPIVAVAPLILIYAPDPRSAQLSCAFVVTFFPIMMNTLQGLKDVDRDRADTVRLYTNSRWKMLILLQMPSAMPSFFAGLKVGGGLALVGAVVAEFAAGSAGANSGLAFRLLEAQYRLNTPRLFAALVLLALLGAAIFLTISVIDRIVLRHWYAARAIG